MYTDIEVDVLLDRYDGNLIELGRLVERTEREREAFKDREEYLLEQLAQVRESK